MVRCIGATPDSLLSRHLYQSIAQELGLVDSSPATTGPADNSGAAHWILRLVRQMPAGTHLTLILAEIDQLDAPLLPAADLPDSVRLLCTCSASGAQQPTGSCWTVHSLPPTAIQQDPGELFSLLEQQFSTQVLGSVSLALSICPVTQCDVEEALAGEIAAQDVRSVLQALGKLKTKKERKATTTKMFTVYKNIDRRCRVRLDAME